MNQLPADRIVQSGGDTYRGWRISFDYPPIPVRDLDYSATHPDYDASFEDGAWQDNGKSVTAATREALLAEIDPWIEENGDE